MSGITGVYYKENLIPDRATVLRMINENLTRGNDYVQVYVEEQIGFGFNALNLTTESMRERQPFSKEGITIMADARLDRRERLVNEFNQSGMHSSIQETDVELLWKAYRKWGIDFPKYIYGEFSFAIWDANVKRLLCGRDYLGFRPLFYKWNGKNLEFSSMLEGLIYGTNHSLKWDREYFIEYITEQGFVRTDKTPYEGVKRLPAAHILILQEGRLEVKKYWDIEQIKNIEYSDSKSYEERFREIFFQAVKDCMRSNSPVSVAMSGGLDSTSIFSAGQLLNEKNNKTEFFPVSLVFDKYASDDERKYIELINKKYNVRSREIVADDLWSFKNFPYDAPSTAEPFVNASTFGVQESLYAKAKEANSNIMLTGAGGDEVLSGSNLVISDYIWNFKWGKAIRDVKQLAYLREEPFFKNLLQYGIHPLFKKVQMNASPWLAKDIQDAMTVKGIARGRLARGKQENQITTNITPFIDQYIAAPLGMEARHPFLDRELVEFLIAIPMEQKLQGSIKKLILKNAMKEILPEPIRKRIDKTAHYSVIYSGLQREWPEMAKAYSKGYLADLGLVDHEGFKKDLHLWRQGETNNVDYLWTIATLELWFYRLENKKPKKLHG
ncbi:asparagine synthetase B [Bacillus sp. SH7-1]|uniref:asparagine synthetase B family protein n=1 Tax=Bacillus cereus group TaxID=86661 RepID=UPI000BF6C091|nr:MULTISPECIES: asparagine synthase-related protein [Bacillus cereus group]PFB60999.1 hypothetical protein CN291_24120 [Bacillus cereus]TXR90832.1 asparagine synthetase B [Bacillus sp. SH7-1]